MDVLLFIKKGLKAIIKLGNIAETTYNNDPEDGKKSEKYLGVVCPKR